MSAIVPLIGTYSASNETMQIEITNADPSNGQIQGTYKHNFTPEGKITITGKIGGYAWVSNTTGGSGTAPFHINFTVSKRPNDFPYCIIDFWNGYYSKENTIIITGVRSYVNKSGTKEVTSLGTLTLSVGS